MAAKSLQELFIEALRNMYHGDKQPRALPKMAKAAQADELRTAFESHLKETENHLTRLEQVFRSVGQELPAVFQEVVRGRRNARVFKASLKKAGTRWRSCRAPLFRLCESDD